MPEPTADLDEHARRPVLLAVFVGLAVALAAIGVVFSIIAIPFFALARFTEPGHGLDEPFIRNGLLHVAVPVGALLGTATGVAVALWYRRGGRLPAE
jgi:hypothetical protein